MTEVGLAKEELKKLAEKVNKSQEARNFLKEWVGKYDGKVISWKLSEEGKTVNFYLVFTQEGAKFWEGEYPSSDMTWITDAKTWRKLYSGELSAKQVMLGGKLWIWGNFNEWEKFYRLCEIVKE